MKLTLSEISIKVERRYKLDEPIDCTTSNGTLVKATEFVTKTRTYEYGPEETEYLVCGRKLKADGTPDKRDPYSGDYTLSQTGAMTFLEALSTVVDEVRD